MKSLKVFIFNLLIFLILISLLELFFGYWFKKENFGFYMRKERKINWKTTSNFKDQKFEFFYKRNYWGFRGEEFNPRDIKIIFQGGSTGNQRYTPSELTIVGRLNTKFKSIDPNLKIYNASTDGKSVKGYVNDFKFWFPKIPDMNPKFVIFYLGINEKYTDDRGYFDYKVSSSKFDQIKDYIKNNSFFVDKFITIKNKYFPTNTLSYDFDNKELYNKFKFVNFDKAKILHKKLDQKDLLLIKSFDSKLIKLNKIILNEKIIPIFITQLKFDGLKDKKLFLINNELKKFALENNYYLIAIDEFLTFDIDDFYDPNHTTPKGSKKIADAIYPKLLKILKKRLN